MMWLLTLCIWTDTVFLQQTAPSCHQGILLSLIKDAIWHHELPHWKHGHVLSVRHDFLEQCWLVDVPDATINSKRSQSQTQVTPVRDSALTAPLCPSPLFNPLLPVITHSLPIITPSYFILALLSCSMPPNPLLPCHLSPPKHSYQW